MVLFYTVLCPFFVAVALKTHRVAVLASGRGTNAERIFSHFANHPNIEVVLLLSSNAQAFAIDKVEKFKIPIQQLHYSQWEEATEMLRVLNLHQITHIVLAGFLWLIPACVVASYRDRIINIHPSLLPRHAGKGMYGMRVHRAVKRAGDKESGITIHQVNEQYDEGEIVFQTRCMIDSTDTPEKIASKIQLLEHTHYPSVIENWIQKTNADRL